MMDSTWAGIAGIVAIVAITALFFGLQQTETTSPLTGAVVADASGATSAEMCDPKRFCDGSRLLIVRSDCSVAESFCQRGCNREALACN